VSEQLRNIVVFFVVAFGLTFCANQMPDLAYGNFKLVLCGFGPLVSGLLCYQFLKTKNAVGISLLGTQPVLSVAVCIVPLVTFCLTQTEHELTLVLSYFFAQSLYCFGEQFGWRHYLQNATNFMNVWLQSLVIGLLWFCWHYSFIDGMSSKMLGREMPALVFAPIMIVLLTLLSYLFGMMVKRTKSILFPVTAHLLFKTGLVTMLVTGGVMCVMLIFWERHPFNERERGA
jgi:membrane protease YdiL (CAAX protease family)